MLVATLGAMTACTSPSSPPPAAPPVPSAKAPSAPIPMPVPRPEPPAKRPPAPAPTEHLRPEQLTGLNRDEAQALLGPPTAETTQAMATVWSYRRSDCALSLVFYPEVETAIQRVLSYEFEGGGDAAACLNRLRESRTRHGR